MINYNKLNTIYKTNSFIEANLIKGMLDNFNIPNFIEKRAIGKNIWNYSRRFGRN